VINLLAMCLKCDIPNRLEEVEEEKHTLTDGQYLKKMNILKKLYDSLECDCEIMKLRQNFCKLWMDDYFKIIANFRNHSYITQTPTGLYCVVIDEYPKRIFWKPFEKMKDAVKQFSDDIKAGFPDVEVKITEVQNFAADRVEILYN